MASFLLFKRKLLLAMQGSLRVREPIFWFWYPYVIGLASIRVLFGRFRTLMQLVSFP